MPSTWQLTQTFLNPTPAASDQFGNSVAISGNNVLVGAYWDDTGATNTGAAYLFDGTTGSLLRTFLRRPAPSLSDWFGNSVAISGNNVLVGSIFDHTDGTNPGAAYLFDGTTGSLLRKLLNPTPALGDYFGNSVAISGNNVLVGTPNDDTGATNTGAAYLFDGTTGSLLRTFLNPTPAPGDQFGSSVAISGNNVLVGTPLDDTGATDAGAAYLFDGTTGSLLRTFLNPTPAGGDAFGSVAISGNYVLVGAPNDDTGATDAGAAYLFDGTTGSLLQTFLNPTPANAQLNGDQFGRSVAISGNNVLVGAHQDDTAAFDAGAAYLFQLVNTFANLSISDITIAEGNSGTANATFTVTLSNPVSTVVTVDYATANSTATAGTDYVAIPTTTLTFNPNETTKTITVQVNGDTLIEPDEIYFINLTNPTNATLANAQGLGTITNDDFPIISLAVSPTSVTEDGTTNLIYTFTRTGATTNALTVNYAIAGTADTTDYTGATPGAGKTITFAAGSSTATLTINPTADTIIESNETVALTLVTVKK